MTPAPQPFECKKCKYMLDKIRHRLYHCQSCGKYYFISSIGKLKILRNSEVILKLRQTKERE